MPKKEIGQALNVTARIGDKFNKEIEDIKNKRLEIGIDKKRKSTRRLTNLIVRHDHWRKIKEEMITLNLEKRHHE